MATRWRELKRIEEANKRWLERGPPKPRCTLHHPWRHIPIKHESEKEKEKEKP